jgi:hypothetical protein
MLTVAPKHVRRIIYIDECEFWQVQLRCRAYISAEALAASSTLVCMDGELNTQQCEHCPYEASGWKCPVSVEVRGA